MANNDVKKFIEKVPIDLQDICRTLYTLVRTQCTEANESIYHGAICFSTSLLKFSPFIYISPQNKWVNLGFFFGADLPDPQHLLIGEGKRMRHIKIRKKTEADNPAIKLIVKTASEKAQKDIEQVYLSLKKKNSRSN